ncbi:MAG: polyprenyl synthetase family protein [Nevskiaceae bacterium]|jgi:octaprenyl-diphosphate synthase|nr:polyprenyl synthetase family protein [Nevskiaceae bacterium]
MTLEQIRKLVAPDLVEVDRIIRASLASPVALVGQVAEYIVAGGGKRLRPLAVVLAARAASGGEPPGSARHCEAAAFIEFIHTATLLHDDVVDHSAMRRGRDTANSLFGNEASVLVGDFVYSRAFQMMAAIGSQRVMEIMADATNVIAEGEVLQLMNAQDPDTTEERYLEVIHRKTAKLFEAGGEVAAVLCGASQAVQTGLAAWGRHLGAAFQLIDDVLDYRGDPAVRGKNLGEDLAEGKPTLPLIHALRQTQGAEREMIRETILGAGGADSAGADGDADAAERLAQIIACIDRSGGIEYTRERARAESRAAIDALAVAPPSPYRDALAELATVAVERDR